MDPQTHTELKGLEVNENPTSIRITDIDIPFGRLIMIITKFMIAAIPAGIIVGLLYWLFISVLVALFT